MAPIVAVDLGATNLRAARFDIPAPPYQEVYRTLTKAEEGPEAVIQRVVDAVNRVSPPSRAGLRVGVAAPGPLNPYTGMIVDAPNLPGWEGLPLLQRLKSKLGCPVGLGNDANLAALGEWRHGAGQGKDHLIYLTISTGIGGGIISGGKLIQGARGLAAELGHMTVLPGGPMCGCGQTGHLEAVASGSAIARRAKERLQAGETSERLRRALEAGDLTAKAVGETAQAGDPLARSVITEAGEYIGAQLAQLAHAFNPEIFVLGGGVSRLGELLFEPILRALQANVMHPSYLESLEVVPAALADDSGLVGAMVLASDL
jgi:glucokinase